MPDKKPSTMCRARSSSREMRFSASGCKNLLESGIARELVFFGGSDAEDFVDNRVGVDPFALGGEVHDQPVPQHRLSERLDVFGRYIAAAMQQGARLGAEDQELHGTRTGAPAHLVADEIRRARLSHARLPHQRERV